MRTAFLNKIDILNADLNETKNTYKKQVFYLNDELKNEKYIKELFVRQISELQRLVKVENDS